MSAIELHRFRFEAADIAVRLAGDRHRPAVLLLHGFPGSSAMFRNLMPALARQAFLIAPDLPGFGASDVIASPSFERYADALAQVLDQLGVQDFHLYLHDFGAAVGLHLFTRAPDRVRGLVIQNANAHQSGLNEAWGATRAYWADPSPAHEAAATTHLTPEGMREQYVGQVPEDIAHRMDARLWEADWRVMSLPGRLALQRSLVWDYRHHVARFDEISRCLRRTQPPALLLWGRHDAFFALAETLAWMEDLPRMEAHVLDGPHFLLETHGAVCAAWISEFLERTARRTEGPRDTDG